MTHTTIVGKWRGPTLLHHHRALAVRQITRDMVKRVGYANIYEPDAWLKVAKGLNVKLCPQRGLIEGRSHARVKWDNHAGMWMLEYDSTRLASRRCRYFAHELAHVYQHLYEMHTCEWLCGEHEVYYYEGPVWLEQHRIARQVENRIFGRLA